MQRPWSLRKDPFLHTPSTLCILERIANEIKRWLPQKPLKLVSLSVIICPLLFYDFPPTEVSVLIHLTVFISFLRKEKLNKKTQTKLKFSSFQMGARERNAEMFRQKPGKRKVSGRNDTLVTVWVDLLTFLLFDFYCYFRYDKLRQSRWMEGISWCLLCVPHETQMEVVVPCFSTGIVLTQREGHSATGLIKVVVEYNFIEHRGQFFFDFCKQCSQIPRSVSESLKEYTKCLNFRLIYYNHYGNDSTNCSRIHIRWRLSN